VRAHRHEVNAGRRGTPPALMMDTRQCAVLVASPSLSLDTPSIHATCPSQVHCALATHQMHIRIDCN
jgi:hypothetical protein